MIKILRFIYCCLEDGAAGQKLERFAEFTKITGNMPEENSWSKVHDDDADSQGEMSFQGREARGTSSSDNVTWAFRPFLYTFGICIT